MAVMGNYDEKKKYFLFFFIFITTLRSCEGFLLCIRPLSAIVIQYTPCNINDFEMFVSLLFTFLCFIRYVIYLFQFYSFISVIDVKIELTFIIQTRTIILAHLPNFL